MRKLLTITGAAFLGLALLFTACKGKDKVADDPKAVVTAFFERMSKKDFDGAAKLATKESEATINMMKKAMDAAEQMKGAFKDANAKEEDPAEDFKNMEYGEAKIDGDNAIVFITNKKKNETIEFPLKKEGGSWKVDFSMATLMKMGMNEANKDKGMDMGTDTTGVPDMNMMNSDTLKKSMEMLDTMMKQINPEKMKEMMQQ